MIQQIEEIIERQYEKIRESGRVLSGIKECVRNIRYDEPVLAEYVERKMLTIAEKKGDLP